MVENPETMPTLERVRRLREQISELKKSWPAHSVSPSMLQRLDDLEEELECELSKVNQPSKDHDRQPQNPDCE